jgi:hypothetical protein
MRPDETKLSHGFRLRNFGVTSRLRRNCPKVSLPKALSNSRHPEAALFSESGCDKG